MRQGTYRPEVVHKHIEHTQKHNQDDSTPLRLEANDDHDASDEAKQTNKHTPEAPLAREDKAHKQEDEQHAARELDIHLAVLLIELRQAGWDELLAHPRVRNHHEQTADDAQVAQEEVQIEDQAVAQSLCDHHA